MNGGRTIGAEEFGALCNLFHTIACEEAVLSAEEAGDILYYQANPLVCDQSRLLTRAVLAYLGIGTGDLPADELIRETAAAMRNGEGALGGYDDPDAGDYINELREHLACKDCASEVRVTVGTDRYRPFRVRVIHSAGCTWYARHLAKDPGYAGAVPCSTSVTHRGPYKRDPDRRPSPDTGESELWTPSRCIED